MPFGYRRLTLGRTKYPISKSFVWSQLKGHMLDTFFIVFYIWNMNLWFCGWFVDLWESYVELINIGVVKLFLGFGVGGGTLIRRIIGHIYLLLILFLWTHILSRINFSCIFRFSIWVSIFLKRHILIWMVFIVGILLICIFVVAVSALKGFDFGRQRCWIQIVRALLLWHISCCKVTFLVVLHVKLTNICCNY